MIIKAIFTKNGGEPATGLSPTVTVYDLTDSLNVVLNQVMTEASNGAYIYDFLLFNDAHNYHVLCDAHNSFIDGKGLSYGGNELFTDEFISAIAEKVGIVVSRHYSGYGV